MRNHDTAPHPSLWTDTAVLAARSALLMARSPTTLLMAAAFPVILLCLLSVSFAKVVMPDASYAHYIDYTVPLFATMGITFATLSTAIAAHTDRTTGFDDRLRTLPISPIAPLAGRIIADTIRNLATLLVVTVVGIGLGFRFTEGITGVIGYLVVPLIYGFGLAWFMVAIALSAASAESAVAVLNAVLLVLSFLSTGFVTIGDLPGWAQPVAEANPITHVIEAMRTFAHGGEPAGLHVLATLGWALGLTLLAGYTAVRVRARQA
ncbi:multidrug ABC transporter permease [Aeromicrobium sp. PE09-221]|uniref:ABC transporter permease n=1 Tax=Aeromicrobium sp. PE09-221 TaxID=1898043 RepID=UPI000B3ED596|nr:ABC transporter permease [Aeromicrobium sp. PE09-221]OUZ10322.1 multidrug ABC transporter permease [Aeromicrobium sp. PE09-221]